MSNYLTEEQLVTTLIIEITFTCAKMSAGYSFFMWGCFVTCNCNTSESFGDCFIYKLNNYKTSFWASVWWKFSNTICILQCHWSILLIEKIIVTLVAAMDFTPFQYSWMFTSFKAVLIDSVTIIPMNVCNLKDVSRRRPCRGISPKSKSFNHRALINLISSRRKQLFSERYALINPLYVPFKCQTADRQSWQT